MRWLLIPLLILAGCASPIAEREVYLAPYRQGNGELAASSASALVDKRLGQRGFLASKNASWMLLDAGVCHLATGSASAQELLRQATESIDYYKERLLTEQAAAVATEDSARAYSPPPFEQLLSRLYFALALIHNEDHENGFAILRQAETATEELCEFQHQHVWPISAARYLLAIYLNRTGDTSNAELIASRAHDSSLNPLELPKNPNLIVIHHIGLAPERISTTLPTSDIVGYVIESAVADMGGRPALSSLTGVPIPELVSNWRVEPFRAHITIDGRKNLLTPTDSITELSHLHLEQDLPNIVTRAATRLLLRRATVAAAQSQDADLGVFTDIAMFAANLATKADTRTWGTLPAEIRMGAYELTPGSHTIQVTQWGPMGSDLPSHPPVNLHLKSGDLKVIHLFQPEPHVGLLVVPNKGVIP